MKNSGFSVVIKALIGISLLVNSVNYSPPPTATAEAADKGTSISIGAFRWDGWVGNVGTLGFIAEQSQKMLSPEKFRFRTPFFATVTGANAIELSTTQASMDQEIAYAKNSGIDYWIYNWYGQGWGLDVPLNLHLSSTQKDDVKWCYNFYSTHFQYLKSELPFIVDRMKAVNYKTVLDGHPLVYLMSNTWTKDEIDTLRAAAETAGLPSLYFVILEFTASGAAEICDRVGAQAISSYATPGSDGKKYSSHARYEAASWNKYQNTGKQVIPIVTTGWDPRPIGEYIASASQAEQDSVKTWYPSNTQDYVQTAKPDEIAKHLKNALDWASNNSFSNEANTVIMYAWNEFTEGGWICPVLDGGSQRLDAIKNMLDSYGPPYNPSINEIDNSFIRIGICSLLFVTRRIFTFIYNYFYYL